MQYETSAEIDAPQDLIWAVLVDVERWPQWTASTTRVESTHGTALAIGSRVRIKQPRTPLSTWEVTDLDPGRSFTWQNVRRGVTTVATHRLAVTPGKRVLVTLTVSQSGALASIVGLLSSDMIRRYIQMEAEGLKRRSEAG